MKNIVLYILFASLLLAHSMKANNLKRVDDKVKTYPATFLSINALANRISNDFSTDLERSRAAYAWMAMHVRYDVQALSRGSNSQSFTYRTQEEFERKQREADLKIAKETLRRKKAVCQGYSELFKALCESMHIPCVVVAGAAKNSEQQLGRTKLRSNHAWNAVKVDGQWHLVDVTWGAGGVSGNVFRFEYTDAYFMMPPEKFVLNHYPDEPKWLLNKVSKSEFEAYPLYYSLYFDKALNLIRPNKGVLKMKHGETLELYLDEHSDVKGIGYSYSRDRYQTRVESEKSGNLWLIRIPYETNKGPYLTIYKDNHGILAFKIK